MGQVLVLDQSYQPLERIDWKKAICLIFKEKVEVIEAYADKVIRSAYETVQMPAVVRFVKAVKKRKKSVKFSRQNLYLRDKGMCQYCGTKIALSISTYEHVVPKCQGGKTTWENIVTSCKPCNQTKGGRTPEQAGMRLITKPVRPKTLPPTARLDYILKQGKDIPEQWQVYVSYL